MRPQGLLRRIAADDEGNTLAIFAAALIPLTIMVGSGLDMGIAYMARAKMQNACDAGVLAARQIMEGTNFNATVEAEGDRFFDFNFPAGTLDTTELEFEIVQNEDDEGELLGNATAVLPTVMMQMFGYDTLELEVDCDATRDMGHNDVMLVLDVTGSMNDPPSNGGGTKIERLRTGAAGLYRALDDGGADTVTRFGIMPYSHTVNVGRSLKNRDILVNQTYAQGTQVCNAFFCYTQWGTKTVHISNSSWNNGTGGGGGTGNRQGFRTSGDACIEERPSIGNSDDPFEIEDTVTRADIDDRATNGNDELRQFGRYDPWAQEGESQEGCPSEATRLQTYDTESAFTSAIASATARVTGGTYHDVGMLWGTRFVSRTGFFSSDNPTERDGVPVNQHIVFMTDGMLDTGQGLYSAHGVERRLRRTQGDGTLNERHLARFAAVCARAREMNITVWVIALDVTDTDDVAACATSEAHFETSDGSDLEEVFERIGQGIGNLRLTR